MCYPVFMDIIGMPCLVTFPDSCADEAGVIRIGLDKGDTVFLFTLLCKDLRRMGDDDDTYLELFHDGSWQRHYLRDGFVIENSSRRARVRLSVRVKGEVRSFKARFRSLLVN